MALALGGGPSVGVPPVFEQAIDEAEPMREGEREVTWDEDVALRPIFDVRRSESKDRTEVHWLFPFGYHESEGKNYRTRFYPFYLHDVYYDEDGFEHQKSVAFP